MKKHVLALALAGALACGTVAATTPAQAAGALDNDYKISSPYDAVSWDWTQYKTGLHNHTTKSDGANTATQMLETAYGLGFNVYAMTDHNVTSAGSSFDHDGVSENGFYLTTERKDAMLAGQGRDGKPGMMGIPFSDEQSIKDHLNTFWAPWNNEKGATLESKIAHVDAMTGTPDPIQHINHPGRYYGGENTDKGPNGEDLGAQAASDPKNVGRYVGLFRQYPESLIGMEIVNKVSDGDSYSDRILWDNVLQQTMPQRNVPGFCNDDAHSTDMLGYAYNQLLMPKLTEADTYKALKSGAFYCSALVAHRELGWDFKGDRTLPAPTIQKITTDQAADTITIQAKDATRIEWIADGKVVATGATLSLDAVSSKVDNYVRAQIIGPNGITFTNAFAVELNTKGNNGRFLSDAEAAQAALKSVGRTTGKTEVVRAFQGRNKTFVVTIVTDAGRQVVRVDAETGKVVK